MSCYWTADEPSEPTPPSRVVRVTVNGEEFSVGIFGDLDELSADALRRFEEHVARGEAEFAAEERYGAGTLTGEFPTFTWTPTKPI